MGIWQNYSCGSHEAAESEAEHVLSEGQKMERGMTDKLHYSSTSELM